MTEKTVTRADLCARSRLSEGRFVANRVGGARRTGAEGDHGLPRTWRNREAFLVRLLRGAQEAANASKPQSQDRDGSANLLPRRVMVFKPSAILKQRTQLGFGTAAAAANKRRTRIKLGGFEQGGPTRSGRSARSPKNSTCRNMCCASGRLAFRTSSRSSAVVAAATIVLTTLSFCAASATSSMARATPSVGCNAFSANRACAPCNRWGRATLSTCRCCRATMRGGRTTRRARGASSSSCRGSPAVRLRRRPRRSRRKDERTKTSSARAKSRSLMKCLCARSCRKGQPPGCRAGKSPAGGPAAKEPAAPQLSVLPTSVPQVAVSKVPAPQAAQATRFRWLRRHKRPSGRIELERLKHALAELEACRRLLDKANEGGR